MVHLITERGGGGGGMGEWWDLLVRLNPMTLTVAWATGLHRQADGQAVVLYFAGIFALLRAMASSTAFSCFSSSSRRDSVLLGLFEPDPDPVVEAEPGAVGLPDGTAGPLPDALGDGGMGRFLSPWGGILGRGP